MPTSQKLIPQNTFFPFRNRKNIMRNGIIISVLLTKATFLQVNKYIFQLTKYEDNDVHIESDSNSLSSIGFVE